MKIKILSPSNASFIALITVCSLVLITSCILNPNVLKKLHDSSILQSIITFNAKSTLINLLCGCFFDLFNSDLFFYIVFFYSVFFLYSLSYLFVCAGKFLSPNCF